MDHFSLIYGDVAGLNTKIKDKPIRREHKKDKTKAKAATDKFEEVKEEEKAKSKGELVDDLLQSNPKQLKDLNKRKKKAMRKANGEVWVDETLEEWAEGDFRIFCGNLGNEVSDEILANAFKKYGSFSKAKVIKDKKTLKSKGFGFVSLLNVDDYIRAMREM